MQIQTHYLTVQEYLAYGDQPVEVVNGEAIHLAPHTRRQSTVLANLFDGVLNISRKLGRAYAHAPYILDGNPRSKWVKGARTPDLSFISRDRIEAHNTKYPNEDEP